MKKLILLCACAAALASCSDPHREFCGQAARQLCEKCRQCGGDYKMCGLLRAGSAAQCESELRDICSAYDSVYTRETASSCLEQIAELRSCDQFKANGKPEICSKLF